MIPLWLYYLYEKVVENNEFHKYAWCYMLKEVRLHLQRIVEWPIENSLLLDCCLCCFIIAIELKLLLYTLFQVVCIDQFFVTFVPAQIQGRVTDCSGIYS